MLKIDKFGSAMIVIKDDDENVIYEGPQNIDCVIEALAFYMEEETEVEEHDAPEAIDPLKAFDSSSLSVEDDIDNNEDDDGIDEYCEAVLETEMNKNFDKTEDYPDDDYD